jgi:hypothetical protein
MTEWTFRLTLRGIGLTDEQLDALYEAGCDDGSFSVEPDGTVLGFFDREAPTEQDAVISEVEAWFERYEPQAVPAHRPRLSPDFLAEVNDRLDLRERLRHSPNAPWRSKLNEALPLGA